jgi:uncharacterized protein (TIGR02145 family)
VNESTTGQVQYEIKRKAVSAIGDVLATNVVTVTVPNVTLNLDIYRANVDYAGMPTTVTVSPVSPEVTPSEYTWEYAGNTLLKSNRFSPARHHFNGLTGIMSVYCRATISGCATSVKLEVNVSKEQVVAPNEVSMGNCGRALVLDDRDGTKRWYPTVVIADPSGNNAQCWMAKDMNVGSRVNMDVGSPENTLGIQKFCIDNLDFNCDRFGGLYTWHEAMNGGGSSSKMNGTHIQGICPNGWHVPTDAEWTTMELNLGATMDQITAWHTWDKGGTYGNKMKAPVTIDGETFCIGPDCNSSGFNSLPAGRTDGYNNVGSGNAHNSFWLATLSGGEGMTRHVSTPSATVWSGYQHGVSHGFSIRCMKD